MWSKVKNSIKKEFNSEPLYNEKYLKAKIKSYNGKINTNFRSNNKPKEGSQFIFLSVLLIDSLLKQVLFQVLHKTFEVFFID